LSHVLIAFPFLLIIHSDAFRQGLNSVNKNGEQLSLPAVSGKYQTVNLAAL